MKYELREITPMEMRCVIGTCPVIYEAKSSTPESMRCAIGPCPEVYEHGDEYFIIGKAVNKEEARQIEIEGGRTLADKVGDNEALVRLPRNLVNASVLKSLSERIAKNK